jgi:Asp-tRNA(Asn)/Glu-tRNA(Gln) amidotransferase A subunit family amidase
MKITYTLAPLFTLKQLPRIHRKYAPARVLTDVRKLADTWDQAYLARISEVNKTFHAVTEINPDALAIAAELDRERSAGFTRR